VNTKDVLRPGRALQSTSIFFEGGRTSLPYWPKLARADTQHRAFSRHPVRSTLLGLRKAVPLSIVLYHHPFSRAATVVWMLEEVGVPYELRYVDFATGAHKAPEFLALNPMGKLPTLTDGALVVTESAAIGLYLADRYAYGRLAPKVDDPARGTFLRWSFFAPSVVEPGATAKASGWDFKAGQVGWGSPEAMLSAMESAIAGRSFILGDNFSMADIIFGGTLRFMLLFKMVESRPAFTAYTERLASRPALQRADARNAAIVEERGLSRK
jgi:glutathione S-transferase